MKLLTRKVARTLLTTNQFNLLKNLFFSIARLRFALASRVSGSYPRLSYSQFGEDILIASLFDENPGFYVDIGSGDPCRGSNTFLFYKLGWSGIVIDPIKRNISRAQRKRPRDKCLSGVVSERDGKQLFFEFDPYEYSTTSLKRVEELAITFGLSPVATYEVSCLNPKEFFPFIAPQLNSFLSIDVEGAELNVLSMIDWSQFRPKVVCVEDFEVFKSGLSPIQKFLNDLSYELRFHAGYSSVYVFRNETEPQC
jgi:hypothetical protein